MRNVTLWRGRCQLTPDLCIKSHCVKLKLDSSMVWFRRNWHVFYRSTMMASFCYDRRWRRNSQSSLIYLPAVTTFVKNLVSRYFYPEAFFSFLFLIVCWTNSKTQPLCHKQGPISSQRIFVLFLLFRALFLDPSGTDISDLDSLKSLQHCTLLRKIDLRGNPCCQSPHYRDVVKSVLINLQELDGQQIWRRSTKSRI